MARRVAVELTIANRILANEGVVDAYGHVSMRNPAAPGRFYLSCSKSPMLVEPADILEFGPDGEALERVSRPLYLERYIHAAIYAARRRPATAARCRGRRLAADVARCGG